MNSTGACRRICPRAKIDGNSRREPHRANRNELGQKKTSLRLVNDLGVVHSKSTRVATGGAKPGADSHPKAATALHIKDMNIKDMVYPCQVDVRFMPLCDAGICPCLHSG